MTEKLRSLLSASTILTTNYSQTKLLNRKADLIECSLRKASRILNDLYDYCSDCSKFLSGCYVDCYNQIKKQQKKSKQFFRRKGTSRSREFCSKG